MVQANTGVIVSAQDLERYKVQDADTWWGIAEKLAISPANLARYNTHIEDKNVLDTGMWIWFPAPEEPSSPSIPTAP